MANGALRGLVIDLVFICLYAAEEKGTYRRICWRYSRCHATIIGLGGRNRGRSEEHTSELQSLMRISYAVFCLKKKHIAHIIIHDYHSLQQLQLQQHQSTYNPHT